MTLMKEDIVTKSYFSHLCDRAYAQMTKPESDWSVCKSDALVIIALSPKYLDQDLPNKDILLWIIFAPLLRDHVLPDKTAASVDLEKAQDQIKTLLLNRILSLPEYEKITNAALKMLIGLQHEPECIQHWTRIALKHLIDKGELTALQALKDFPNLLARRQEWLLPLVR